MLSVTFKKIQFDWIWQSGLLVTFALNLLFGPAQNLLAQPANSNRHFKLSATFLGTHAQERVGYWLQRAGDVNGDGLSDFLIANYHNKAMGYDAGAVYLILGRQTDQWKSDVSLDDADARFLGFNAYAAFGYLVGGADDINGDGLDDFVIGAPAGNNLTSSNPGSVYLIWGRQAANWGKNFVPANAADASYVGEKGGNQAGKAVAIVGDLNNDGFADVAIGAPFYSEKVEDGGKVYFIFGRATGWQNRMNLTLSEASFYSIQQGDRAGYMVAGAGDVNGDGLDDVLIGAPNRGNVYLIFGRKPANWGHDNSLANADVHIIGEKPGYSAGWALASAGDVNKDGYVDILITAPSNAQTGTEAGKTYLIFGKPKPWERSIRLDTVKVFFTGEKANDNFGWATGSIQDLNLDGYDDFMIGAWHNDQRSLDAGKAYLVWGKEKALWSGINASAIPDFITGETDSSFMGFHVAAAGDVNGDQIPDFIVSAPYNSQSHRWAGKIYLYLGQKPSVSVKGKVAYFDNHQPVAGVSVNCRGAIQDCVLTDQSGHYHLKLQGTGSFQLIPFLPQGSRQDEMTILSYDAALIARHVLNFERLQGFSLLAADVDQDHKVTLYDASLIARHVVQFPRSTGSYVAEWIFDPPIREYQNLSDSLENQNFTALILGNVHGGWNGGTTFSKQSDLLAKLINNLPDSLKFATVLNWLLDLPTDQKIYALDMIIEYLPADLDYTGLIRTKSNSDISIMENCQPGKIYLSAFSPTPVDFLSEKLQFSFQVRNSCRQQTTIAITRLVMNNESFGTATKTIEIENKNFMPEEFYLAPNFPNPFNGTTQFRYTLPTFTNIKIEIYNLQGQLIRTLLSKQQEAGEFFIEWDGLDNIARETASGIYFCRATFQKKITIQRLLKLN